MSRRAEHERTTFELEVEHSVEFAGAVQDVSSRLAAADVFVLATHTESSPIAIMEAMAARLPVVASDIPGTREILGDDAGILVPLRDPGALADATAEISSNPDLAERLVSVAAERVVERYSTRVARGLWAEVLDA